MDPPTVYIEKEPFLNMVWSAIESFNRECLGYMFGKCPTKDHNFFVVENAVNIQLARVRKNMEVQQSRASSNRTEGVVEKYGRLYPFIGDFHSHPEWHKRKRLAVPSEQDKKAMIQDNIKLSIIIKISTINKERLLWENISSGGVHGSLDKYKFHLNAFSMISDKSSKEGDLRMLEIRAVSAMKALNRALGYK